MSGRPGCHTETIKKLPRPVEFVFNTPSHHRVLTHRVDSYHLVKLPYGHYADRWHAVRQAASWRDRLGYLFMPPDWQPGPDVGDRMALGLSEQLKRTRVARMDVARRLG